MCYLNMIKIREFEINDYDDVIKLWISSNLPFKPRGRDKYDKIEKEIKNDNSIFLIAEFEGKIIGSVFGTHDGRKGWINRLAISPNFQGKDLAKKLDEREVGYSIRDMECLKEAKRLGITKKEFDEYKKYWNMPNVLLQILILKELKEINSKL